MPAPNGRIWLLKNVLINNGYEHTFTFKTAGEQFSYWLSFLKYEFSNARYLRKTEEYVVIDKPITDLEDVNYMIFENNNRKYYAFITEREYASDKATYLHFEIDVMQTYLFDFEFMPSYILREHCDRWTADHKPIYSRTSEDLDYGTEYTTEVAYRVNMSKGWNTAKSDVQYFAVLCKEHGALISSGTASEPTVINDSPTPYVIYLVPYSKGYERITIYHGADLVGNMTLQDFMDYMGRSAFGESVQQIVHLPYLPFTGQGITQEDDGAGGLKITLQGIGRVINGELTMFNDMGQTVLNNMKSGQSICKWKRIDYEGLYTETNLAPVLKHLLARMSASAGLENAMPTVKQWEAIKANPLTTERDKRFESKLLCYPYRFNLLNDFRGQPVLYKNEYIAGENIELMYSAGIGFNTPYRYWLNNYRNDPEGRQNALNQVQPLESTIISDAYYTYMLQNKNQLQANVTNASISGASATAMGALGGLLTGGIGGAIAGGIGAGVNSAINVTNLIRSQNALKSDLRALPDTIINSNDCSMSLVDNNLYVTFYRKKIACEFENIIADSFNMQGYTCKRVKVPNYKSRARFNFLQTIGANIKGKMPFNDLAKMRAIFDKGITFWHYSTQDFNPLNYEYENIERSLL